MKKDILNNWKLEHFVTYLYLAVGFADGELIDIELEMAKDKLSKFLLTNEIATNVQPAEIVDAVLVEIQHHSKSTKNDVVHFFVKEFILTDSIKMELLGDLTDIIAADYFIHSEEYNTLAFIRSEFYKAA